MKNNNSLEIKKMYYFYIKITKKFKKILDVILVPNVL